MYFNNPKLLCPGSLQSRLQSQKDSQCPDFLGLPHWTLGSIPIPAPRPPPRRVNIESLYQQPKTAV